ncbi:serine hydrolase domain-containing protein [Nonomuraea thailandensis]
MSVALSDQDKITLWIGAWGAVSLISAASAGGSAHKAGTDGSLALATATGLVGHVLGSKPKGAQLGGKSVAALADQALPALTTAMDLLSKHDPAEASNYRSTVLVAVEAAMRGQRSGPAAAEMARKIAAALDAAEQDRPGLRKIMQKMVESGFVGVELRVHDGRGEWLGRAGARELGGTEQPPVNGHVRIGSNTKTFTAVLVLQLVAEGKAGLDVPVDDYLPEFGLDRRITVRMLLQHTSGIFNFTGEYYPDGTSAPGIAATNSGKEWVDNRFKTYLPEELVRLALSKPARFEPGSD